MNAEGCYVKCPFYKNHDSCRIACEGVTDDCYSGLRFKSKSARRAYMGKFCKDGFKNCPFFKMLDAKYD